MVVRIPGLDEPALFGPPIVSEATLFDQLPDETRAEMERLQAIDDTVFVACSLADLTTRQRGAALAAEEQAFLALDDPEAASGHIDGFASRLDDGFAADVDRVVGEQEQLSVSRPSPEGLDLFRRRADGVRRGTLARNVMLEDGLRQRNQRRMMKRAIDGLQATVEAEPDVLDEALGRLGDLTGASRALIGDELAGRLDRETRSDLATAAARGLMAQDAEMGLEALRSGAYDSHLDEVTRNRLIGEADGLSQANTRDRNRRQQREVAELASLRETVALDFMTGFRKRIETGEVGFAEIMTARQDGMLSPQRADILKSELEGDQQRRADRQQRLETVTSLLKDGRSLDPDDPDHRDLADIFFDSVVAPEAAALPPRDRIGLFARLPDTIGIMPPGAMCPLGGLVLAGEPADRVAAAQAVAGIIGKHPGARDCLPPPVVSLADALTDLAPLQIPADEAIKLAEGALGSAIAIRDPDDPPPRFKNAFQDGSTPVRLNLLSADGGEGGEGGEEGAPTSPPESGGGGTSGQETQVAAAAALAVPALVGGVDAAAIGKAILGVLGAAGILGLSGDTPQDGAEAGAIEGGGTGDGSDGENDQDGDASDQGNNSPERSGQTAPKLPDTPEPPDPPTSTPPKPGGRGKRARDSSKAERHGNERALDKVEEQINRLEAQKGASKSRKERQRIQTKIQNIKKNAFGRKRGDTDHNLPNPMQGGRK